MVQEFKGPIPHGEVDYAEHSQFSRAKKVIDGPLVAAKDDADARTKDPIHNNSFSGAISLSLELGKAYRVISNIAFFYRMSRGGDTALTTDIFVPANTPVILATGKDYDSLDVIPQSGSGFIQATEVR